MSKTNVAGSLKPSSSLKPASASPGVVKSKKESGIGKTSASSSARKRDETAASSRADARPANPVAKNVPALHKTKTTAKPPETIKATQRAEDVVVGVKPGKKKAGGLEHAIELEKLRGLVVQCHGRVLKAGMEAIRHARSTGEHLRRVQKIVGYGKWTPWFAERLSGVMSARTASAYMRVAKIPDLEATLEEMRADPESQSTAKPTLAGLLEWIAPPRPRSDAVVEDDDDLDQLDDDDDENDELDEQDDDDENEDDDCEQDDVDETPQETGRSNRIKVDNPRPDAKAISASSIRSEKALKANVAANAKYVAPQQTTSTQTSSASSDRKSKVEAVKERDQANAAPRGGEDESEEVWLETLPLWKTLSNREDFKSEALLWRRTSALLEQLRAIHEPTKEELKCAWTGNRYRERYSYLVAAALGVKHPSEWTRCLSCKGAGTKKGSHTACDACKGGGFAIAHEGDLCPPKEHEFDE